MQDSILKFLSNFLDLEKHPRGDVIFLTGEWGSGKTYLWKGMSANIKPTPIYIPLFGVSSVDQISSKVVSSYIDPVTQKNSLFKYGKDIFNGILSAGSNYLQIKIDFVELIKERKVFCFDDLERLSSKCDAEEVLGFINYLAEHKGHRCLVILNEKELSESIKTAFHKTREKLGFHMLDFELDRDSRIDDFTKDTGLSNEEIQRLKDTFSRHDFKNLRIIYFIIKSLAEIKTELGADLPESFSKFFTAVCIHESTSGRKQLSFYTFNPLEFLLKGKDEKLEIEEEHQKFFYETYFEKHGNYRFFPSAIRFLRGNPRLDLMKDELLPSKSLDQDQSRLDELSQLHMFFEGDSDLKNIKNEIMGLATNGKVWDFANVYTMVRIYSSCVKLLEESFDDGLPAPLMDLARNSAAKIEDTTETYSSLDFRGNDVSPIYLKQLLKVVEEEQARRSKILFLEGLGKADLDKVKLAIKEDRNCLKLLLDDGILENLLEKMPSEEVKYRISAKIIDEIKRLKPEDSAPIINKLHTALLEKYTRSVLKMNRLRLYRLIEETGLKLPEEKPRAAKRNS